KSEYEFHITTDSGFVASCNGIMTGTTDLGSKTIWHYKETVPMSSYLVAVSIAEFKVMSSQYQGMEAEFPVELYALESDTANVRKSFENLDKAIAAFEEYFGPQPYSRVAYTFVPFNSGAMEHAGNIAYPKSFANGSKDFERIMAHELAHHWWGNLVTCSNEGDMWLN